ncbi:hypothetical protein WJX72_001030 [[Myrmecia] bisecta]|uniref:Protein kinase domain-containing protein n=1 Tax=[Myrmecia] bisecta TaxID=41462 RepID=A0AAW1R4E0_9CHLO
MGSLQYSAAVLPAWNLTYLPTVLPSGLPVDNAYTPLHTFKRLCGTSRRDGTHQIGHTCSLVCKAQLNTPTTTSDTCMPSLDWPVGSHERFRLGEQLGKGSFGAVFIATDIETEQEYAMKVLPKHRAGVSQLVTLHKFNQEVEVMTHLRSCRQCIHLHGVYQDANHLFMVLDLCKGGHLGDLLQMQGLLTEKEARCVITDVLRALAACHAQCICYGDIKPSNMLLLQPYPDLEVKLADFGLSTFVAPGTQLKKRTGTPVYMAPELYTGTHGVECDLWGLGMLMYQLLAGRLPFWGGDTTAMKVFERVMPPYKLLRSSEPVSMAAICSNMLVGLHHSTSAAANHASGGNR